MPDQLIYFGVIGGQTEDGAGSHTAARTPGMSSLLAARLEPLSYFDPSPQAALESATVSCHRILDVQGLRYHVLSLLKEAGLNQAGRPCFLAHHVIFTVEDISRHLSQTGGLLTPPQIFLRWDGWIKLWQGTPDLSDRMEDGNLLAIHKDCAPCRRWDYVSGDAANAFGLLAPDYSGQVPLNDGGIIDNNALGLFAESLQMLEARDAAKFRRGAAWDITFTTRLQTGDAPGDFYWQLTRAGSPAFERLATAGKPLALLPQVRQRSATQDEMAFARMGRTPLKITVQPSLPSTPVKGGDKVHLKVQARCLPAAPISYSWCKLDHEGTPLQPPLGLNHAAAFLVPVEGIRLVACARTHDGAVAWSEPVTLGKGKDTRGALPLAGIGAATESGAGKATDAGAQKEPARRSLVLWLLVGLISLGLLTTRFMHFPPFRNTALSQDAVASDDRQQNNPASTNSPAAETPAPVPTNNAMEPASAINPEPAPMPSTPPAPSPKPPKTDKTKITKSPKPNPKPKRGATPPHPGKKTPRKK